MKPRVRYVGGSVAHETCAAVTFGARAVLPRAMQHTRTSVNGLILH